MVFRTEDIWSIIPKVNQNADALSRRPIVLLGIIPPIDAEEIIATQKINATLSVYKLVDHKSTPPKTVPFLKVDRYGLGMHQFCQQNYWNNKKTKAKRKMLAQ